MTEFLRGKKTMVCKKLENVSQGQFDKYDNPGHGKFLLMIIQITLIIQQAIIVQTWIISALVISQKKHFEYAHEVLNQWMALKSRILCSAT